LDNIALTPLAKSAATPRQKNIFEILQSPDNSACYYGPCFWVINPEIVPAVITTESEECFTNSKAICLYCQQEVGIYKSKSCLELWDFGIEWIHISPFKQSVTTTSVAGAKNEMPETRAISNFRKTVFASLYEWSFNATCKILLRSVGNSNSLFLWNIDRNLTIFLASVPCPCAENGTVRIQPQKVIKFLYAPSYDGKSTVENPFDLNVISESSGLEDHSVVVPSIVFSKGTSLLERTSLLYLNEKKSFKCGYLTLNISAKDTSTE